MCKSYNDILRMFTDFMVRLLLVIAHAGVLCIDFVYNNELASLFDVKGGSDMCSMDFL